MRRILDQIGWFLGRHDASEERLFEPGDWAKLITLAPNDLRLRIAYCRCLADCGNESEALRHLAECRQCANTFEACTHDRLLAVSAACRIRDRAWREGAVLGR